MDTILRIQQIQKSYEAMTMARPPTAPSTAEEAQVRDFKFWKTQPVPQLGKRVVESAEKRETGPIEPNKEDGEIRQEPLNLPDGYEWYATDIDQPEELDAVYDLLNENYVEDGEAMFRFEYSKKFLRWALKPPGWLRSWHLCVRAQESKKVVGFISATPAHIQVHDKENKMVEINFLCVHKKLRAKRLAPVLIKEITRRVHLTGIFQAAFTAGVFLPTPVGSCRYWHRSLNPKKLVDVRFSHLPASMTMQRMIKHYKLPTATVTPGLRPMEARDVPAVTEMLNTYLNKFVLHPIFTEDEIAHWLIPKDEVVDAYVVEDPETKELTDLTSFYTLSSTVIGHPRHSTLKAAYSFYHVPNKTPLLQLMNDALTLAQGKKFDVFNALDLQENGKVLKELKFGIGDGTLQYYLYNYACPTIQSKEVGLVML
ncbi:glycylpeptide N-tetradecanoyltransferase 1 [Sphaeroforma arctica JP610]|uniref:Glycylpeptide N-tetradecanoyltransferase n=1 Tax=Sphaeroforma arctica JP610 TaxID=667725 RepID=A0A0L0G7Z0_9EUKA|nr:glycylpeptide N-tetradecanoyltransferase 1 [Sphaeroforma arctica JP610]KNC85039.1 glycylpeptide N-tetradecanoyltransferase 1 [Sphaeroforma arctica JP610]|eukprot:XP_014158941.1 glycylpeptide N-tetradecanoyltransferase 1 [Sphaeroforma arctica JP610]